MAPREQVNPHPTPQHLQLATTAIGMIMRSLQEGCTHCTIEIEYVQGFVNFHYPDSEGREETEEYPPASWAEGSIE